MMALKIRVISMDGGPASLVQLIVRSILLVLFSPVSLLVGIIVMMLSRYRQRTGDHMAKTTVVRARVQPMPAPQAYAGAGQAAPGSGAAHSTRDPAATPPGSRVPAGQDASACVSQARSAAAGAAPVWRRTWPSFSTISVGMACTEALLQPG